MSDKPQSLIVLESIDATLKQILLLVRPLAPKPIATDKDLDGKYGDPKVHFDPKDWSGESYKGLRMSECPSPFLDLLAETLDYFAEQAEAKDERYNGKLVAPYKRADAARARGWSKRNKDIKWDAPSADVAEAPNF